MAFLLLAAHPRFISAQTASTDVLQQVGIDQHLDQQIPLDLRFRDETGKTVQLGDYFTDQPVILILAYYRCPMLCTEVLNGVSGSLKAISFEMGRQYRVVTVSIDPQETPELAAAKKTSYEEAYGRPGAKDGWHFLTGDQASIQKLAQAVGFRYVYNEALNQFAHASGIFVVTPTGKLSRYLLGIDYPPRDLRLALVEASAGKIGSPADQLLLLCFHYDESTGRYTPAVMKFVRLGGAATLAIVGLLIGGAWFRDHRQKRSAAANTAISLDTVQRSHIT